MGGVRRVLAARMRSWADRLDWHGAPKSTGLSFYFVEHVGLVVDHDGQIGCPLWYLGRDDYEKAHTGGQVPL